MVGVMSVVFALLFVVGFVLMDHAAHHRSRAGSGPISPTEIPNRGEPRAGRPNAALLGVLISAALLSALALAACHVTTARSPSPDVSSQPVSVRDNAKRQLEAELADAAVVADLGTLKAYQKALVGELAKTTIALSSYSRDATLLKRKELIELVLTNAGGTGLNDRLSDFETAMQTVASRTVFTDADVTTVRVAVANLRSSAASWKTGAFASLGAFLGLHWEDGRGLTIGTPYVWGGNGWESAAEDMRTKKVQFSPGSAHPVGKALKILIKATDAGVFGSATEPRAR